MKVSIIIPCKIVDSYVKECVNKCFKIDYPSYEIFILPDSFNGQSIFGKNVRVIPTGCVTPLRKRLMAASLSAGDVLAFIDSDAYPTRDWLKNALRHFNDSNVAAVVGPSLTPANDDIMSKASGLILSSPFGGGSESIRYTRSHYIKYVSEAPTCNMIIRKSVLNAIRDFLLDVWPGEEIILCGMITKDLKKKIVYDPEVVVYHHRRKLFGPHLKQIWMYGKVKGNLLKKYRQYVRPVFFLPSLLVLGIVVGIPLAMLNPLIGHIYGFSLFAYFFLSIVNATLIGLKEGSSKLAILVLIGTIATHICYGIAFMKGMLSKKL
jgi:cellulose synthase/poly-beta-1,6-N-acetylglucosamine synthase-like glycosyltransferase